MGAQVIDVATEISELGTALVATMAKRNHSLSDVTRETNMAYETLIGIQAVRGRIRRPTIDKVAEYLGWTVEQVAEAAQRPSKSALVTQNGVRYPVKPVARLGTMSCETCRDRARCQTVVNAGGLALCEEVIDADAFDKPRARMPIDHRPEAVAETPAPVSEEQKKPVLPSPGLALTVLEMMIDKAQGTAEEKGVRDWVAAAQAWMPTVHRAVGSE